MFRCYFDLFWGCLGMETSRFTLGDFPSKIFPPKSLGPPSSFDFGMHRRRMKKLRRGQGFLAKSGDFEGDADMIGAAIFLQSSIKFQVLFSTQLLKFSWLVTYYTTTANVDLQIQLPNSPAVALHMHDSTPHRHLNGASKFDFMIKSKRSSKMSSCDFFKSYKRRWFCLIQKLPNAGNWCRFSFQKEAKMETIEEHGMLEPTKGRKCQAKHVGRDST